MNGLLEHLQSISPGEPVHYGSLTLLPLTAGRAAGPDCLSLTEALEAGQLQVTEVSEAGSVPELLVRSQAPLPVLIVEGEALLGARQDRFVNLSLLVPAGAEMRIPVSCMEVGRWSYTSPAFRDAGVLASPALRQRSQRAVHQSLSVGRGASGDQSGVWEDIDALHQSLGSRSRTRSLRDAYAARPERVARMAELIEPGPDQQGMAIFARGRLIALELTGRPRTWAPLQPKLLRSLGLEQDIHDEAEHAAAPPCFESALEAFAAALASAEARAHPSPGLGENLRVDASALSVSALRLDGELVHLAAYLST